MPKPFMTCGKYICPYESDESMLVCVSLKEGDKEVSELSNPPTMGMNVDKVKKIILYETKNTEHDRIWEKKRDIFLQLLILATLII